MTGAALHHCPGSEAGRRHCASVAFDFQPESHQPSRFTHVFDHRERDTRVISAVVKPCDLDLATPPCTYWTDTFLDTHTHTHSYTRTLIHTHTRTHTCTHAHTHTQSMSVGSHYRDASSFYSNSPIMDIHPLSCLSPFAFTLAAAPTSFTLYCFCLSRSLSLWLSGSLAL